MMTENAPKQQPMLESESRRWIGDRFYYCIDALQGVGRPGAAAAAAHSLGGRRPWPHR
jgi:hypothetical protein